MAEQRQAYRVHLSEADEQELQRIPGIGETRARELCEWRDQHGPFRDWSDVEQVPGFSAGKLDGIRAHAVPD